MSDLEFGKAILVPDLALESEENPGVNSTACWKSQDKQFRPDPEAGGFRRLIIYLKSNFFGLEHKVDHAATFRKTFGLADRQNGRITKH
jgi:hypothetical protein